MKIYHILGVNTDSNGEVSGWMTYSYIASRQTDKKYIHIKRLTKINPGDYKVERKIFELDPVFDPKKHDNLCPGCFFTSKEKLVEFLRTGLRTMHQRRYDGAMKLCDKMHPRDVTKKAKSNVG